MCESVCVYEKGERDTDRETDKEKETDKARETELLLDGIVSEGEREMTLGWGRLG